MKPQFERLFEMACRSSTHVLLTGATGTGKSSLAERIHREGVRGSGPFVNVNLASLYEGTLESELFGHERGAFTGADRKRVGRLEMANGGTLFLDEIGELSPKLQARLLEFLQTQTITAVGGNRSMKLDVRIIAATHRDLEALTKSGGFRADLFHRLRVLEIPLLSLADKPDKLDVLVHLFLSEFSVQHKKRVLSLSPGVAEKLENYNWPGNIRELRNVLEYAVLAACTSEITLAELPPWLFRNDYTVGVDGQSLAPLLGRVEIPFTLSYQNTRAHFEKEYLQRAFFRNGGRLNRTAREIGLNKATLLRRIKAYGIDKSPSHPQ